MKFATIKRKILVAGLGLLVALVLLETGLHGGRKLVDVVQQRRVLASLSEGDFRILCVGDSTTELGGDAAWPAQLQELLNQTPPRRRLRVINAGRTCTDSGHVAARLPHLLELYRPQLVVGMIGINEHGIRMYRRIPTANSWPFKHLRSYRLLVLLAWRVAGGEPAAAPSNPAIYRHAYSRRNFESIARTLERRGIPLVLMQYPRRPLGPLRKLLDGLDRVLLVDHQQVFEEALQRGRYEDYFGDRFAGDFGHCTRKGHLLLAQNLLRSLRRARLLP